MKVTALVAVLLVAAASSQDCPKSERVLKNCIRKGFFPSSLDGCTKMTPDKPLSKRKIKKCEGAEKEVKGGCTNICLNQEEWEEATEFPVEEVAPAAVNGGYSAFGAFSACSAKCGGGTQKRSRACNNPAPANGGAACVGPTDETKACNAQACIVPVNGGYSAFGAFSACSAKCGGGTQKRSRACNNPAPANGGAACVGPTEEAKACNAQACAGEDECTLHGDMRGNDIIRIEVDSWSECKEECLAESTCRAVTYVNQQNLERPDQKEGFCYLKNTKNGAAGFTPRDDMWLLSANMNCVPQWSNSVAFLSGVPTSEVSCPSSHPFVYFNGAHCCATKREKVYGPNGALCDGSEIGFDSLCCEDDKHTPCPSSPCARANSNVPETVTRTVAQCMLKNQVLPGAQIKINGLGYTANIGTLEACVELCKNTAGCAAVGRKTAANRCFMKTAAHGNLIENSTPYTTNGLALCCLDDTCTRNAPLW